MATALRRSFSFSLRNLLLFRNRSILSLPTLSHLSSLSETTFLQNPIDCNRLFFDSFLRETRRGFAKGRKSSESLPHTYMCFESAFLLFDWSYLFFLSDIRVLDFGVSLCNSVWVWNDLNMYKDFLHEWMVVKWSTV